MPYIPTGAIQAANLADSRYWASVGVAGGNTLVAGYQTYQLATMENPRAVDYITGGYGIAASVFAATPIVGPMLQGYTTILGAAQFANDYFKAKRKERRIKRMVRHAVGTTKRAEAGGVSPELAAFLGARTMDRRTVADLDYKMFRTIERHPYNPRAVVGEATTYPMRQALQRAVATGKYVRDPETGRLILISQLKEKESGEFGEKQYLTLIERPAPGLGLMPAPFVRYQRAEA